jgi:hypothetical protein
LCRPEDVVAGSGGGTILLPAKAILADGDDCGAAAIKDRGVAMAGVEGTITGHGADLFTGWDLVQKMRQNGAA